jgi:multidrug transporter EmrE-like cation transporter
MQASTLALILVSVCMSAAAQIVLKFGMSSDSVRSAIANSPWTETALQVLCNPWVLLGLALYGGSMVFWLAVLSRVEVSFAYPFVAVGFVVTMLCGWLLMGDAMSVQRVAGTLLIAGGVVLVARSA